MNLSQTIDLYGGGPGSGCNPKVASPRCGRPNIQKKIEFQGLHVSVENKKGSYRTGRSSLGVKWKTKMNHHYGYLRGVTKDNTHEKRDVYVGPHKDSKMVFVVNQVKKGTNITDEQKHMIGFKSMSEAKKAFLSYVPKDRFGGIKPMHIEEFKSRISNPRYAGKTI